MTSKKFKAEVVVNLTVTFEDNGEDSLLDQAFETAEYELHPAGHYDGITVTNVEELE